MVTLTVTCLVAPVTHGFDQVCSIRRFLVRQYRAQMRRRAQQVQQELVSLRTGESRLQPPPPGVTNHSVWRQEAEQKMLAALLDGEEEEERTKSLRRERAVADAVWMKRVLEEQLELEREREAALDHLHR